MKKKNYLAPQSKTIDVSFEMNICQSSPGGDLRSSVSDPFTEGVPDEEDDWT